MAGVAAMLTFDVQQDFHSKVGGLTRVVAALFCIYGAGNGLALGEQYVEVAAQIDYTNYAGKPFGSFPVHCVIGSDRWRIEHWFVHDWKETWYYDGTNTYKTVSYIGLKNYIPQGFSTADNQKLLEQIWGSYAATNVLLSINPASIKLTVEKLSDRRSAGIYSRATNYVVEVAVGYLPRVVSTHPTAKEIYQDQGYIVCATVEQFVTTSANPGSVDPLFVSFYWVEKFGKMAALRNRANYRRLSDNILIVLKIQNGF